MEKKFKAGYMTRVKWFIYKYMYQPKAVGDQMDYRVRLSLKSLSLHQGFR